MTTALDTNVLVRLLVRDDEVQFAAAARLVQQADTTGQPLLIPLGALLETEWMLPSHYRTDERDIANAFARLLEVAGVIFEHEATVEETLYIWTQLLCRRAAFKVGRLDAYAGRASAQHD